MKKTNKPNRLWVLGLFASLAMNASYNLGSPSGSAAFASTGDVKVTLDKSKIENCLNTQDYNCDIKAKGKLGKTKEDMKFKAKIVFTETTRGELEGTTDVVTDPLQRLGGGSIGAALTQQQKEEKVTIANISIVGCDNCGSLILQEVLPNDKIQAISKISDAINGKIEEAVENNISNIEEQRLAEIEEEKQRKAEEKEEKRIARQHKQCLVTADGEKIRDWEDKRDCFEDQLSDLEGAELARFVDNKIFPTLMASMFVDREKAQELMELLGDSDTTYAKRTLVNARAFGQMTLMKNRQKQMISRQARTIFGANSAQTQDIIRTEFDKLDQSAAHQVQQLFAQNPLSPRQAQDIERALSGGGFSPLAMDSFSVDSGSDFSLDLARRSLGIGSDSIAGNNNFVNLRGNSIRNNSNIRTYNSNVPTSIVSPRGTIGNRNSSSFITRRI